MTYPIVHTYTLTYSTHHTLFIRTPPNPIKLFLISILFILAGSTSSSRCYRVILCPAKSYKFILVFLL